VNPWLIAAAVMLATILEVLDTSVANVAVPNIAGNLSASTDEATWVLTSYLVSNAIVLPMTGWLCSFFRTEAIPDRLHCLFSPWPRRPAAPRRRWASSFSPASPRGPPAERSSPCRRRFSWKASRLPSGAWRWPCSAWAWSWRPSSGRCWGAGLPTTTPGDGSSFINVPLGALAVLMSQAFIEDPPYLRDAREKLGGKIDYVGFGAWRSGWARSKSSSTAARRMIGSTRRGFAGRRSSRWCR
jgi:DHA2 family multidrug resistance protein